MTEDRPSCPDCNTPAQSHAGRGRWVCGLCEKGFPAGLDSKGERALIAISESEAAVREVARTASPDGAFGYLRGLVGSEPSPETWLAHAFVDEYRTTRGVTA